MFVLSSFQLAHHATATHPLSSFQDGDPDLYASVIWGVNSTAPMWFSLTARAEVVAVSFNEPILVNSNFTFPLEFDIAVAAAGGPTSYLVEVVSADVARVGEKCFTIIGFAIEKHQLEQFERLCLVRHWL